ncbi:hypothetical protein BGX26_000440 [Mortierella sp. AD094]|nr:hypothetical protein BGX26_000440 [Mortierella sp. AD094]
MLDLPELRALLAIYLDKSQLAAASAVCKSWNDSFTPVLYSKIAWPWNNNNNNNNNATTTMATTATTTTTTTTTTTAATATTPTTTTSDYDTLRKYANHVRAFRILGDILSLPLEAFSRLEILIIRTEDW